MARWTGWAPAAGESAHWYGATSWLADGGGLAARWSKFDGDQVVGGPGNEPGASRLMRWRCFSHAEVRAKPRKGLTRFDPYAPMLRWHL